MKKFLLSLAALCTLLIFNAACALAADFGPGQRTIELLGGALNSDKHPVHLVVQQTIDMKDVLEPEAYAKLTTAQKVRYIRTEYNEMNGINAERSVTTDGEGKEVSFKNTIIMLTSNLASETIQRYTSGAAEIDEDELVQAIRPELSNHFRPALLARMTIVPYRSLNEEAMKLIAGAKLGSVVKRLRANNNVELEIASEVTELIVERCTETETGARNIETILAGSVLPKLAHRMLERMSGGEMPPRAELYVDEDKSFALRFSDEPAEEETEAPKEREAAPEAEAEERE